MLSPILFLTGFLAVISTPGLIAQALEERRARKAAADEETTNAA